MGSAKTILSATAVLHDILTKDKAVAAITGTLFPIVGPTDTGLPYIAIQREALTGTAVKGNRPPHRALVNVDCYHDNYGGSLELAEAVAAAMESYNENPREIHGLYVRQIMLTDATELVDGDAFCQSLKFEITI